MPLRIFWYGRHVATMTSQSLALGLLAAAALIVFACFVHVVQQAVEQGHRRATHQVAVDAAKPSAGGADALAVLAAPAAR